MRLKLLLLTMLFTFTSHLYAMSDEEIAEITNFLSAASENVKTELEPQLMQGVLGFNSPKTTDTCEFSGEAEAYITANKLLISELPLTHISLCNFNLDCVPKNLFRIEGLEVVVLKGNMIKTLPNSLKKAKSLRILNLYDNLIETLPDCFNNLPHLQKIDLGSNHLSDLPNSLLTHELQVRQIWAEENLFGINDLPDAFIQAHKDTKYWMKNKTKTIIKTLPVHINPVIKMVREKDESGHYHIVEKIVQSARVEMRTFTITEDAKLSPPRTLVSV